MTFDQRMDDLKKKLTEIETSLNESSNIAPFDTYKEKIIAIETIKRIQKQLDEQQKDIDNLKRIFIIL